MRASGRSPWRSTARSLATTVAAAPSLMPGALPAVTEPEGSGSPSSRAGSAKAGLSRGGAPGGGVGVGGAGGGGGEPIARASSGQQVGPQVHALHAAGHDDLRVAGLDLRSGEHDRLHPRTTDAG